MAQDSSIDSLSNSHPIQFHTNVDVSTNFIECQVSCDIKDALYAFYLVVDGKTVVKKWYKNVPECTFRLEYDRTKEHSVVFFIRNKDGEIFKKTEKINQHEIDFIPSCSIDKNSIQCVVSSTQTDAQYAFYLYLNDEDVVKKWYTKEMSVVFDVTGKKIDFFKIKYFARDQKKNIFSKTNGFKRHEPRMNVDRSRTNFDFFLSFDGEIIYKKVNPENNRFSEKLLTHGGVERFRQILSNQSKGSISKHIAKGFGIENDGSYKSRYIHGYRLDLLSSVMDEYPSLNLPSIEERKNIKLQCRRLMTALREADAAGELIGDWALHNLIYSPQENCIFNVDLEGFITYNPLPEWANLEHILTWIEEFISLLES